MSDRVAVLHQGRLQQIDSPATIYERPRNTFIADFVGNHNLLPAKVMDTKGCLLLQNSDPAAFIKLPLPDGVRVGQEVKLALRPEALALAPRQGNGEVPGRILCTLYRGREVEYLVAVGQDKIRILTPGRASWMPGQEVDIKINEGLVFLA